MNGFTLPADVPQESFIKHGNKWYARIVYGNTIPPNIGKTTLNDKEYYPCDIWLVNVRLNEIIPVCIYDEHQNGIPVLDYYGKNRDDFYPIIIDGIQHPISYSEAKKLENILVRMVLSDYDISNMKVFLGYFDNPNIDMISATDFINHTFDITVSDNKLTEYGMKIYESLKQIRDCRNDGVYHGRQIRKSFEQFCKVLIPYGYATKDDLEDVKDITHQYIYNDINQSELEERLFGFNGVKNRIHNRIRMVMNTDNFKKLTGNPMIINNYMELM